MTITLALAVIATVAVLTASAEPQTEVDETTVSGRPNVEVLLSEAASTLSAMASPAPSVAVPGRPCPAATVAVRTPKVATPIRHSSPAVKAALKALREGGWSTTRMSTRVYVVQSEPASFFPS